MPGMSAHDTQLEKPPVRTGRRRRARILSGEIGTIHSVTASYPSHHLDPLCPGLERVEEERRGTRTFTDAHAMGMDDEGRICRLCTLESLLRTVLRGGDSEPSAYVTFASTAPGSTPGSFTQSSQSRVRNVARIARLDVVQTSVAGTVVHGLVPVRSIAVLERNLRTLTLPWVRRTPSAEHVDCFWTLLADEHGEDASDPQRVRSLWRTAGLLTR